MRYRYRLGGGRVRPRNHVLDVLNGDPDGWMDGWMDGLDESPREGEILEGGYGTAHYNEWRICGVVV